MSRKKKNNPNGLLHTIETIKVDIAEIKTDVQWLKESYKELKDKVEKLVWKVATIVGAFSIIGTLLAKLMGFI